MKKKRILIVDDDVALTQTMKINLEDTEVYEVRVENDSRQALASARDFLPDLILLDIVMPDLDGGDVSAQLSSDPLLSEVPVLIITALVANSETGLDAAISSGGQAMVAKPIQFDKLTEAIERRLVEAA